MKKEKNNQAILIIVIVVLLIIVLGIGLFIVYKNHGKLMPSKEVVFNQVYYSEYKLDMIDENYYIGYLEDKQINVIIDKSGKEIFSNGVDVYYDGIYKTKEDNYLIYNNRDNKLTVYIFNGSKLEKLYSIDKVSYVKPIIYTNGNISYIVGFSSNVNGDLYLYMLNDSGVTVIRNASLLGDEYKNNVYYTFSDNYLIVINKNSLCGVVDYEGRIKIAYRYKDIMNTYDGNFIVKNKKGKYGILNINKKEVIKTQYKAIDMYANYYLIVDKNNKMAVFNKELKNITGFEMKYDPLLDYELRNIHNSINLWQVGNNIVVVNNYLQDFNKTEYNRSEAYFIKGNKIDKTINQIGFNNDGLVYSYDKKYNVTIYDSNLVKKYNIKLGEVKKITQISKETDEYIKISYLDLEDKEHVSYYKNGKLDDSFAYGHIIDNIDDYYISRKDNKFIIYNRDFKEVDTIEGKNLIYKNGYLIVDSGIYKVERRG